mmetsp:Transcript_10620/g.10263  ORF Transcript_10620/g.10263 Transcript_10620/m.10263 type:complete len:247 (-) Transcript_10620:385-1125(-)
MEWIFSLDQLQDTPSRRDGILTDQEALYREKIAWFIEELGKDIKCDRLVVSTGLVLFHRFYCFQSFKQHNRFVIAVACLFLASKVEECPKKLRDIIHAYFTLRVKYNGHPPTELEVVEFPNRILLSERLVLQTLCFDLQIIHPYKLALDKIKDKLKVYIPSDLRQSFHQNAVNFMNDSYRTTLCLQYTPSQIASSAIFLATIQLNIKPINPSKSRPQELSWFEISDLNLNPNLNHNHIYIYMYTYI